MTNPVHTPDLSPDEMSSLCDFAMETIKKTDQVLRTTSYPDIGAHMRELESAEGSIEQVELFLDRKIDELKNSIGAVAVLKKDLKRKWEASKRKYWELRKFTPSSS